MTATFEPAIWMLIVTAVVATVSFVLARGESFEPWAFDPDANFPEIDFHGA